MWRKVHQVVQVSVSLLHHFGGPLSLLLEGGDYEVLLHYLDGVMALLGHAPDAERLGALPVIVPGLA